MPRIITDFQVGLVRKLLERGKIIGKEVFNAIVGFDLLKEDIGPENAYEKLKDIFPATLLNRTVKANSLVIKQEP